MTAITSTNNSHITYANSNTVGCSINESRGYINLFFPRQSPAASSEKRCIGGNCDHSSIHHDDAFNEFNYNHNQYDSKEASIMTSNVSSSVNSVNNNHTIHRNNNSSNNNNGTLSSSPLTFIDPSDINNKNISSNKNNNTLQRSTAHAPTFNSSTSTQTNRPSSPSSSSSSSYPKKFHWAIICVLAGGATVAIISCVGLLCWSLHRYCCVRPRDRGSYQIDGCRCDPYFKEPDRPSSAAFRSAAFKSSGSRLTVLSNGKVAGSSNSSGSGGCSGSSLGGKTNHHDRNHYQHHQQEKNLSGNGDGGKHGGCEVILVDGIEMKFKGDCLHLKDADGEDEDDDCAVFSGAAGRDAGGRGAGGVSYLFDRCKNRRKEKKKNRLKEDAKNSKRKDKEWYV
ncbi:hypothetical protein HELRODRAFT_176718 [Helobdella robusta]|uniref:Uncharacterized protein n=1 Tax=Helobdella robusta TaxID=6412 RepID=T1FAT7_HELRO|nr:hypothetical protein HELRODRAFT_176718 [Helobdella robusta]ESN99550.1 hypothetical protein HELRODRAFT_176718 [Helobdella robusta]